MIRINYRGNCIKAKNQGERPVRLAFMDGDGENLAIMHLRPRESKTHVSDEELWLGGEDLSGWKQVGPRRSPVARKQTQKATYDHQGVEVMDEVARKREEHSISIQYDGHNIQLTNNSNKHLRLHFRDCDRNKPLSVRLNGGISRSVRSLVDSPGWDTPFVRGRNYSLSLDSQHVEILPYSSGAEAMSRTKFSEARRLLSEAKKKCSQRGWKFDAIIRDRQSSVILLREYHQ